LKPDISEYLHRPILELYIILNIAHGRPALDWPYGGPDAELIHLRHSELKAAIGNGVLAADIVDDKVDRMARIRFTSLNDFATARARKKPKRWQWLTDFCSRWSVDVDDYSIPDEASGDDASIYRTGVQGRPTAAHIVEAEMRRRAGDGELAPSLEREVEHLYDWLENQRKTKPIPRMGKSAMKNSLRDVYRELKRKT
jgi:hypothetical protein